MISHDDLLDLELAKIDNLHTMSVDLQFGHFKLPVLTSISRSSKMFPHFLQEYSLIGNLLTSICVNYDALALKKVSHLGPVFAGRRFMLTAGRNWL